jgi:signal transduction histidine kinase
VRARRSLNWRDPAQAGVRFTLADTGAGMEPAVRERVFEAFFTTKELTGTGLGLWVSYEIVVKHRGLVHVRSRTAAHAKISGTVFQIFIPDGPEPTAATSKTAAGAA